ncbi:MAG: hypothetical protein ACLQPD_18550, partial [Desulfomonilaceae bacterium]
MSAIRDFRDLHPTTKRLLLARFLRSIGQGVLVVDFALYLHALGWNAIAIGLLFTSSSLFGAVLSLGVGLSSDRLRCKPFLLIYEAIVLTCGVANACGAGDQPQQSTMSPQHRQPRLELAKKLSFLILSSTFTYFRNDSPRRKDIHVWVSPETILSCLCLNTVSSVLFTAIVPANDEDRDAVERSVRGDREAFDLLVEKYYKKIYSFAYR